MGETEWGLDVGSQLVFHGGHQSKREGKAFADKPPPSYLLNRGYPLSDVIQIVRMAVRSSTAAHQQQQQQQQQAAVIEAIEMQIHFRPGSNEGAKKLTRRLVRRIMNRSITPDGVRRLIRRGADPTVTIELSVPGHVRRVARVCLLALAIDDFSSPTALESALQLFVWPPFGPPPGRLVLPLWPSRQIQAGIINALVDEGADVDGLADGSKRPVEVAVRSGNATGVEALVGTHGAKVDGMGLLHVPLLVATEQYEDTLIDIFGYLLDQDPDLATESNVHSIGVVISTDVVYSAAKAGRVYSRGFIEAYLDLVTANGATLTHVEHPRRTALYSACFFSAHHVVEYLCDNLTPADINASHPPSVPQTPLDCAAFKLAQLTDPHGALWVYEDRDKAIEGMKGAVRTLLRSGAMIGVMPTAERRLVLDQYVKVLNALPTAVMGAINAALAPQRSLAAVITPWLAVGPNEAPIFGWRIASYLFDMDAAKAGISEAIGVRGSDLARRVCAAAQHFVESALYKASISNREVMGHKESVEGEMVRVPLQCFAVRAGSSVRRLGVREVVHKARLDEVAAHGLQGVVKGFNTHLGNTDCVFQWGQLEWADHASDASWRPLGIN
ncbi:unnamed protein product [Vitrella brassicaformis CCMP3155]|uniref:Uncharacterized protein n=1 Tax=Vitrella brassicaformis (strain CCMP3155) TaxID=1169540 RepID=A0A0G4EMP8_VITBC|nr:unnamed protein product [Vitrella brassicaformis CCMP3155]|eukprot:CEL98287.1 unnamed protein product [Vitrella brassicaformis CCMP3155]